MQIVVLNGRLSEAEEDAYIRQVTREIPMSVIDKLILDIQGDHVNVRYVLHQFREVRKMGGECIGVPADWNYAKQAELRDTVPNPVN